MSICALPTTALAFAIPDPIAGTGSDKCPLTPIEPGISAFQASGSGSGKSSAILSGQQSALDVIRQQQSQPDVGQARAHPISLAFNITGAGLDSCWQSNVAIESTPAVAMPPATDDFLGSVRIGIRNTPFNAKWQRVSSSSVSREAALGLLGTQAQVSVGTLSRINRLANRYVEYAEDIENYGTADYWATANETLRSRRGDCEDFAILKYQLLVSLGFDPSQMYLTLARDLVRNADHAVLIVRLGERHYMLDNATDVLLPANVTYDYRPTISFNSESSWLHGSSKRTRIAANTQFRNLAYLSDSAVSSALVTGLNR